MTAWSTSEQNEPSRLSTFDEAALKVPLSRLTDIARDRLARAPICLVDAGFRDDSRWATIIGRPDSELSPGESAFPHLQALQLAHQTLTLAWTAARASQESACIMFGMSRKCAEIVSRAGIQIMQRVAERHHDWIRPAWENQPEIWRHLIATAIQVAVVTERLANLDQRMTTTDVLRSISKGRLGRIRVFALKQRS